MSIQPIQNQTAQLSVFSGSTLTAGTTQQEQGATKAESIKATQNMRPSADSLESAVDTKAVEAAVQQIQDFTQSMAKELHFSVDQESDRVVVKVIDSSTDEVIRQMPSEEVLAIAKALDHFQGLFLKQEA